MFISSMKYRKQGAYAMQRQVNFSIFHAMKPYLPKFAYVAGIALALVLTFSCSGGGDDGPVETYEIIGIGDQIWVAENLNSDIPNNDTDVCYEDDPDNCTKYGRLYNWATAMALPPKCNSTLSTSDADCTIKTPHKGICFTGWHIPSDADWDELLRYVDSKNGGNGAGTPYESNTAGRYLKASDDWDGTDKYSFAALPGGYGNSGDYENIDNGGYWWSSSANDAAYAHFWEMGSKSTIVSWHNNDKNRLHSVRCVKDN